MFSFFSEGYDYWNDLFFEEILILNADTPSVSFDVSLVDDSDYELNESFSVSLNFSWTEMERVTLDPISAVITILDDDSMSDENGVIFICNMLKYLSPSNHCHEKSINNY